ncbi:MAG: type I-C CRISPR-associated protein Cas5c [Firmicutes bacterium]|nr:type I-C CRISPR-associated protein Cas5c [Bacillota bacterium]
MSYGFKIMVKGDYACFTRSEMKVERVSYDVPTPGALEGLLKSIYWKPAVRYVIDKIVVMNPIRFVNIRRNEVREKVSLTHVKKKMKGGDAEPEIYTKSCINQRGGMVLKDVCYGIEFHFEMTNIRSDREDESKEKHYNIIMRRLKNGQCFRQPVLGCREFSVSSIELVDDFPYEQISPELKGDTDLGFMLYRMNFKDNGRPKNDDWEAKKFSDAADASFYRPHMVDGVIDVKKYREAMVC